MARPRVLVVDDEKEVRQVIAEVMEMDGLYVQTASNGVEALALLNREVFSRTSRINDLELGMATGLFRRLAVHLKKCDAACLRPVSRWRKARKAEGVKPREVKIQAD